MKSVLEAWAAGNGPFENRRNHPKIDSKVSVPTIDCYKYMVYEGIGRFQECVEKVFFEMRKLVVFDR